MADQLERDDGTDLMRLPSFLVIGAMKSGTTTLYNDLLSLPQIYLPEKELGSLNDPEVVSPAGTSRYSMLFNAAPQDAVLGEVSATYAKLPDTPEVVEHASRVLGEDFQVIYVVRDPVERAVSHHHHLLSRAVLSEPIDAAIDHTPELIEYGRYMMQLQPWLELVGRARVRVIPFEAYVRDRSEVIGSLADFLGVSTASGDLGFQDAHNQSKGSHVATGPMRQLVRSRAYRRLVRPLLPEVARSGIGRLVLSKAPDRPAPPSSETVTTIIEQTKADYDALGGLAGPVPLKWDVTATRHRFASLREGEDPHRKA